jgi:hypothetical protein
MIVKLKCYKVEMLKRWKVEKTKMELSFGLPDFSDFRTNPLY